MKFAQQLVMTAALVLLAAAAMAQQPENILTESSGLNGEQPIDDIVEKRTVVEHRVLPYDHVREADIFWEKRIWRVIDVREKMNLPFAYPPRPLFQILLEGVLSGELTAYSVEDDEFKHPLDRSEVASKVSVVDTITIFDPDTYEEKYEVVRNDINPEDIKRYRIKEIWFFDEESSTMKVRILGIAPLYENKDDQGNVRFEQPLFWIYYPHARELLARERVFNEFNDASPMTWEDLFEMRFFSSYVYKASNVRDRRLQDYLTGIDLLLEGKKIEEEIFNFEQDLWSY